MRKPSPPTENNIRARDSDKIFGFVYLLIAYRFTVERHGLRPRVGKKRHARRCQIKQERQVVTSFRIYSVIPPPGRLPHTDE